MLEVINDHDLVAIQAFQRVLVNGILFDDSLIMRMPTKMVDVLSQASELMNLEDDRRMSARDRPKERSYRYRDTQREVSAVEMPEGQNR